MTGRESGKREQRPRGELLRASTRREGSAILIELQGEMDLSSVDVAEKAFAEVRGDDVATLGIDLRGLTFLDSSGLRFILGASKTAKERDWKFFLVRGSEQVHRVFDVAGLDGELTIVDQPGEAIRAGPDS